MKILIPMSGTGKRFLKAGYTTPKPFIRVNDMPIIEHIVRNFSEEDEFIFGINEDHFKSDTVEALLNRIAPKNKIIPMPYREGGPCAVVRTLFPYIDDKEPVIVNYCDFSWVWDYEDFKRKIRETDCEGAVVCYRGFHPHLLGSQQYATLDARDLWMNEIREKYSWHKNKQDDWTSSGTYYFKKGASVKKYFTKIQERPHWKISGEHYVSQIFQLMKEDDLKIFVYEIPFMLQWGTPEDLEDYLYWSDYFYKKEKRLDQKDSQQDMLPPQMTVMVLMAGAGKRFLQEGYEVPKPFIPVDGMAMVVEAARSLPRGSRYLFVTRESVKDTNIDETLKILFHPAKFICIPTLTEGQACSALCAKDSVDLEAPLLIGSCDYSLFFDSNEFVRLTSSNQNIGALIFTYRNNPMVRRGPQMYGWVQTDASNRALKVSVKTPLSGNSAKNHAVVGAFWFKKGRYLVESAEAMIEEDDRIHGEFYIDQCMNHLIRDGLHVYVFEVERCVTWGTPDELRTYQYWQRFFDQAAFHPYKMHSGYSVIHGQR